MRQLTAFMRKEWMEQIRTSRFWILLILFVLFGIMNPAIAKLTPWLFEMMAEAMEEQGLIVQEVEVTALTSWGQYYKNISMMLIVMVIMSSGVLTSEYQKGTLINMLTKGLPRWKVLAAKGIVQFLVWSICYWISYGITYVYTEYYWDNSIAKHCFTAAFWAYLLGVWLIALIFLGSSLMENNMSVLLLVGVIFAVCYLGSVVPDAAPYMPTKLMETGNLLTEAAKLEDFTKSLIVTGISSVVAFVGAVIGFNKKMV